MGTVHQIKEKTLEQMMDDFHRQYSLSQEYSRKSHNSRVSASQILKLMRKKAEADGIDWWPWFEANSVRSRKDAEKLLAYPDDQEAALTVQQKEKDDARERMSKSRERSRENKVLDDLSAAEEEAYYRTEGEYKSSNDDTDDDYQSDQRSILRDALHLVDQMSKETYAEFVAVQKQRGML